MTNRFPVATNRKPTLIAASITGKVTVDPTTGSVQIRAIFPNLVTFYKVLGGGKS